jgi:hypothetical protein
MTFTAISQFSRCAGLCQLDTEARAVPGTSGEMHYGTLITPKSNKGPDTGLCYRKNDWN